MNKNNKPFAGAYSQRRRYSNASATNTAGTYNSDPGVTMYQVQCYTPETSMGTVRLEVVSASAFKNTTGSQPSGADYSAGGGSNGNTTRFREGTWLRAIAEPLPGYRFVQWQTNLGNNTNSTYNTNLNPYTFKLTKNSWLGARFEKIAGGNGGNGNQTRTVQVQWNGEMGRVTCSSPLTYDQGSPANSGSVVVSAGSMITLEAVHKDGYHFVKWQGVPIAGKTDASVPFNVNNNYNIRAIFAKDDNGGGGGGGNGNSDDDGGQVIGKTDNPPTPGSGETPANTTNSTTSTGDTTGKVMTFVKKYWWAILIVGYLYYKNKKGGLL